MAWRREGFDTRLTSIKGLSNTSEPEEVRQPTHPHSKPNMSQNTEAGHILAAVSSFQEHVNQLVSKSGEASIRNVASNDANIKKVVAGFTFLMIGYVDRPEVEGDLQSPMLKQLVVGLEVPVSINRVTYDTTVDLCSDVTMVISIPHVTIPGVNIPDFALPSSHRTKLASKNGNLRKGPIVIDLRIPTAPFNVSATVSLAGNDVINVDLNSGHATLHL